MTAKTAPAVEYVSLSQAAKDLGVFASSVSYYVKQGKLATVEVAGHRAVERTVLEAFVSARAIASSTTWHRASSNLA